MFYIVNFESRTKYAYRDGSPIIYGSEELAKDHARFAQELTGFPHRVMHISEVVTSSLRTSRAPWIK